MGVLVILNAVTSSRAVASLLTVRSEGDDPERLVFDRRREFAELAVPNRRCDAGSQWAAVVRSALADRGAAPNDRLGAGDDVARVRGGDDREQGFWIRRASGYWFARDGIVLLVPQDDSFCFRTRPSARYRKGDISVTAAVGASLVLCHVDDCQLARIRRTSLAIPGIAGSRIWRDERDLRGRAGPGRLRPSMGTLGRCSHRQWRL